MNKVSDFSTRIQEVMNLKRLKQVDLIERTGIEKGKMSKYIKGVVEPKPDILYLLSDVLGVSDKWLFGYDVPMVNTPLEVIASEHISSIESLADTDKAIMQLRQIFKSYDELADEEFSDDRLKQILEYAKFIAKEGAK